MMNTSRPVSAGRGPDRSPSVVRLMRTALFATLICEIATTVTSKWTTMVVLLLVLAGGLPSAAIASRGRSRCNDATTASAVPLMSAEQVRACSLADRDFGGVAVLNMTDAVATLDLTAPVAAALFVLRVPDDADPLFAARRHARKRRRLLPGWRLTGEPTLGSPLSQPSPTEPPSSEPPQSLPRGFASLLRLTTLSIAGSITAVVRGPLIA